MKFYKVLLVLLLVSFAIPLAAQAGEEHGGKSCSLATLNGGYGSFAEGTSLVQFSDSPPPPYPAVAVALHVFDGNGNWSFTYSTSLGGAIVPWGATATGKYTVTPDCELTVVGATPSHLPILFTGTITGEGVFQEAHVTFTDPAKVQSPTLRKTPPSGCSQETLKGEYSVFGQGFLYPGAPPFIPVAHVGSFVADGNGKFWGKETFKVANTVGQDTFTATYTVNPDCTISAEITATPGGEVIHEVGTITGVGQIQEVHLIHTGPGWVFADTGKKK